MVAVSSMATNSLSSSCVSPARALLAAISTASFHPHGHGCLSIIKMNRVGGVSEQRHRFTQLALQHFGRITVRCNGTSTGSSSSNVVTDMDVMLVSLLQEMGIGQREVELISENNPALRFKGFTSIRARVQSLQHLGVDGLALCRLISKRPDLLTAEEVDSLIRFLKEDLESQMEPGQLERLLSATEPACFLGFERKVRLLLRHGIPREKLAHVLNNVNLTKALCVKSDEEIERTITFLNRFGGVNLILHRPAILNYDLDNQLIPRIGFLTELSGGDEEATGTVLRKLPAVLAYTAEHLKDHVDFLRSFAGLTDQEIFRIVMVYPNLFSASRKRKLHPRIDFLKQCGLSSNDIFRFLIKAPLFLSLSFEENLAYKLVFLVKIGYENKTKDLALAMGAVTRTSFKNLQEVIGLFLKYGLSCGDVLAMSKKHPQILQYNPVSLEEKIDYLIEGMGREIGELLAFPAFLGYKLDTRIKHRYEARRKVLGEGMSLNKLLSESAKDFKRTRKTQSDGWMDG